MGNKTNHKNREPNIDGQPIPQIGANGEIVYIYKNEGDAGECGN